MKRLVILGSSGFVGSHLEAYFRRQTPTCEVIGLNSHDIDLTSDRASVQLADYLTASTTVIMCSGIKSNYGSNLVNYLKNVSMAANVCRAVTRSPVRSVVFFSSIAVYGVNVHNRSIREESPIVPDTHYGLAKYVSEGLFSLELSSLANTSLLILRMPTMYGPREKIAASTPSGFLTNYLQGEEVTLFGDGAEAREFLFIDDVSRLVDSVLQSGFTGVLNVGAGHGVSYRDALDCISSLLERPLVIHHRERTKPKIDKIYDPLLLRKLVPSFRFTPLDEGLRAIWEHATDAQ